MRNVILVAEHELQLYRTDLTRTSDTADSLLKRFDKIEVMGEPNRVYSSFIKGYETLPARIAG